MSLIPTVFRNQREQSLISYDFINIAEGTGAVVFYPCVTTQDGIGSGVILLNKEYSSLVSSKKQAGTTTFATIFNKNFDVEFNLPKTIKGSTFVSIETGGRYSAQAIIFNPVVSLRKVSGGVETTLGTTSGAITRSNVDTQYFFGTIGSRRENIEIDIPRTHFKKGDKLRLNVNIWGNSSPSSESQTYGFGNDPIERDDGTSTDEDGGLRDAVVTSSGSTLLRLTVPFVIDL